MHILIRGSREAGGWCILEAINNEVEADNRARMRLNTDGHTIDWGSNSTKSLLTARLIVDHLMKLDVSPNDLWPDNLVEYTMRLKDDLICWLPRGDWQRTDVQLLKIIFPGNWLARWWWTRKIRRRRIVHKMKITLEARDNTK